MEDREIGMAAQTHGPHYPETEGYGARCIAQGADSSTLFSGRATKPLPLIIAKPAAVADTRVGRCHRENNVH